MTDRNVCKECGFIAHDPYFQFCPMDGSKLKEEITPITKEDLENVVTILKDMTKKVNMMIEKR